MRAAIEPHGDTIAGVSDAKKGRRYFSFFSNFSDAEFMQ